MAEFVRRCAEIAVYKMMRVVLYSTRFIKFELYKIMTFHISFHKIIA